MAGHMGSKFRTILNLEIIKSDLENDLIYVKGSIPGSKNSIVYLRKSTKIVRRKTTKDKEDIAAKTISKKETPKAAAKSAAKKAPEKTNVKKDSQTKVTNVKENKAK